MRRAMTKTMIAAVCACATVATVAACGGSDPSAVVARVGPYAVTKELLNEWMTEKIGEDYFQVASHQVPTGLVSEPADYPTCVSTMRTLLASLKKPSESGAELTHRCHELYRALKEQALEYLVSSYWSFNFYKRYGIDIAPAQVQHALDQIKPSWYPAPGEFQQVLASHRRTLAQELLIVKNDVLASRVKERLFSQGPRVVSTLERAVESAQTTEGAVCSPGYVVLYCRGYRQSPTSVARSELGSPAILIEEVVR